jgi:hypothetical protein
LFSSSHSHSHSHCHYILIIVMNWHTFSQSIQNCCHPIIVGDNFNSSLKDFPIHVFPSHILFYSILFDSILFYSILFFLIKSVYIFFDSFWMESILSLVIKIHLNWMWFVAYQFMELLYLQFNRILIIWYWVILHDST